MKIREHKRFSYLTDIVIMKTCYNCDNVFKVVNDETEFCCINCKIQFIEKNHPPSLDCEEAFLYDEEYEQEYDGDCDDDDDDDDDDDIIPNKYRKFLPLDICDNESYLEEPDDFDNYENINIKEKVLKELDDDCYYPDDMDIDINDDKYGYYD